MLDNLPYEGLDQDLTSLLVLLNSYTWVEEDGFIWKWDHSGSFTISSLYKFINFGGILCPMFKIIWQNIAPLNVRLHAWLVINNCILTGDRMRQRHLNILQKCVFCNGEIESTTHIFLECPFSSFFWNFFSCGFEIGSLPTTVEEWWTNWRLISIPKNLLMLWDMIMMAYMWILWRERNDRIFNNANNSNLFLLDSIICFVVFWSGYLELPLKRKIPTEELLLNAKKKLLSVSGDNNSYMLRRSPYGVIHEDRPALDLSARDLNSVRTYRRRR